MNLDKVGAMIARAAGLILILVGLSGLLSLGAFFQPQNRAVSGLGNYEQGTTNTAEEINPFLHDSYYVISGPVTFFHPVFAQLLAGMGMIVFSKPLGRLLAIGLKDPT